MDVWDNWLQVKKGRAQREDIWLVICNPPQLFFHSLAELDMNPVSFT